MASAKKVDKKCEDCGALLIQVYPSRKYCDACGKKRQNEKKAHYRTVKGRKGSDTVAPIPNPNAKYCKGCMYWWGAFEGYEVCNYIFCKGHRRPCPPGKDCTEKVIGKMKRSRKLEIGEVR
jgi:hypothetical protein